MSAPPVAASGAPSPFFAAQRGHLIAALRLGPLADLACGRGRHALAAARAGWPCLAIDRNPQALADLARAASDDDLPLLPVRADLETPHGLPLAPGRCGALLVFRFLFRPLAAALCAALAPGGLLVYETFTLHQKSFGYGPGNAAFLLRPGELLETFRELEILEYWEGVTEAERPEALARLVARRRR